MMVRVTVQIFQSSKIQILQNPEQVVVMSRSGTLNRTLSLKYDILQSSFQTASFVHVSRHMRAEKRTVLEQYYQTIHSAK